MFKRLTVLGTADWNSPIATNQHYVVSHMSTLLPVTFVESTGLRRPKLNISDINRILNRLLKRSRQNGANREIPPDLEIVSPILVPLHGKAFYRINRYLLMHKIDGCLTSDSLLWTYTPATYGAELSTKLCVYHCVDLLGTVKGIDPNVINQQERRLAQNGAIAIGSSEVVVNHLTQQGFKKVLYWPNVADSETFSAVSEDLTTERSGILFSGNLTKNKLDFALMQSIAKFAENKRIPFYLAGPIDQGTGKFSDELDALIGQGATYLGSLSLPDLAVAASQASVGVIPYDLNEYTHGVFPLKIYEYLASGLSVVSTPLPSVASVAQLLTEDVKVSDSGSFLDALEDLMGQSNDEHAILRRQQLASEHSWEKRNQEITGLVHALSNSSLLK